MFMYKLTSSKIILSTSSIVSENSNSITNIDISFPETDQVLEVWK